MDIAEDRNRGQQKNIYETDLEKEIWTTGFRYSWRKMEAAEQNRAGGRLVVYVV